MKIDWLREVDNFLHWIILLFAVGFIIVMLILHGFTRDNLITITIALIFFLVWLCYNFLF